MSSWPGCEFWFLWLHTFKILTSFCFLCNFIFYLLCYFLLLFLMKSVNFYFSVHKSTIFHLPPFFSIIFLFFFLLLHFLPFFKAWEWVFFLSLHNIKSVFRNSYSLVLLLISFLFILLFSSFSLNFSVTFSFPS